VCSEDPRGAQLLEDFDRNFLTTMANPNGAIKNNWCDCGASKGFNQSVGGGSSPEFSVGKVSPI
jgi:hypothetical protein